MYTRGTEKEEIQFPETRVHDFRFAERFPVYGRTAAALDWHAQFVRVSGVCVRDNRNGEERINLGLADRKQTSSEVNSVAVVGYLRSVRQLGICTARSVNPI